MEGVYQLSKREEQHTPWCVCLHLLFLGGAGRDSRGREPSSFTTHTHTHTHWWLLPPTTPIFPRFLFNHWSQCRQWTREHGVFIAECQGHGKRWSLERQKVLIKQLLSWFSLFVSFFCHSSYNKRIRCMYAILLTVETFHACIVPILMLLYNNNQQHINVSMAAHVVSMATIF